MKNFIRALLPIQLLATYHYTVAVIGAWWYRKPSHKLVVIGVTGTKGKSTTAELIAALLRTDGKRVAVASTIHFVIGDHTERNLYKMTMPGRARLQAFMRRAVEAGCTHAIIEMTSEGAAQFRHIGIDLDALVFTNLAPEHIEAHGGFENYLQAKLMLARGLAQSSKRPRIIVANADDKYGERFLNIDVETKAPFALADADPYTADDRSVRFVWRGSLFTVPLPGLFNLKNCLAALTLGEALGLPIGTMQKALEHIGPVQGRAERIEKGQPFAVIIDYAHTPDSLRALYETYANKRMVCVLGSTGGGRDAWKRPEMGSIAEEFCDISYLTNEDPYDEDPKKIVDDIAGGFKDKQPKIIIDRRDAIAAALKEAREGDAVLITGKGTDPYIMGPSGSKHVWSDSKVAAEELAKLGYN